jgi:hypothetical protein
MARFARQKNAARPLAIPRRANAEADATPRVARAPARNRSNRSLVENRRRLHRHTLGASRLARRSFVCARAPTRIALRARTNLQARNPAKTETTFRRQNHPRHPFPRRLKDAPDHAVLVYNDMFFLLTLSQGNALRETKTGHES